MPSASSNRLADLALLGGAALLVAYAALLLGASLAFIAHASLGRLNLPFALLVVAAFFVLAGRRGLRLPARTLLVFGIGLALFALLCTALAAWIYDLSWDGLDYQQKAVYALQNGWNPVYTLQQPLDSYESSWLNHYPKAPWVAAASINLWTGSLESGKVTNLLHVAATLALAFAALTSLSLGARPAAWLACLVAFNPVSVSQLFTYYVDGQVASGLAILVALFVLAFKRPSWAVYAALLAALLVGLNVKFTGTVYFLALSAAALGLAFLLLRRGAAFWKLAGVVLAGWLLGVFVLGFQPYITNTLRFGNPLYPTFGGGQLSHSSLVQMQMPEGFAGMDPLRKLYLATFSPAMNAIDKEVRPKFPLAITAEEVQAYWAPDVRVGGFGPWFGAALLLALLLAGLLLMEERRLWLPALLLAALVALSGLINPQAWWARYSPQLWLVPLILLAAAFLGRKAPTRWAAYTLAAVLSVNLLLVAGYATYSAVDATLRTRATLRALAEERTPILVYTGRLEMAELKFQAWKLDYDVVKDESRLACPQRLFQSVKISPVDCDPADP